MTTHLHPGKILKTFALMLLPVLFAGFLKAQNICNPSGNLMIFTNYDGGTLTINVDQNIPNLYIGVCSYEGTKIVLTGAFVANVVEVRYAGYNGNNAHCGSPTTSISTNFAGQAVSTTTSIAIMPPSPLSNSNGYGSIICGYSCSNNTSQGGCNTVDQVEAYFLTYFSGTTLFAHKVQYGCWTGTHNLSAGGTCCPPIPVVPGTIAGGQTICAGETPAALTSQALATGGSGTITYTWQSSTTSTNSGFTNISGASATGYTPSTLPVTTHFRRASSTATNNVSYSNVITVVVLPLPVLSVSGPTAVCMGSTTTLTASGGTNYIWSLGGQSGQSIVLSPTVNLSIITITCFPVNGCSVAANVTIVTNPLPAISVPVIPPVCLGQTLSIVPSGAASYTLMPGNVTGNPIVITPTVSNTYTLFGKSSAGCVNFTQVAVTVNPLPIVSANSTTTVVCLGESTSLIGGGAISYIWLPGNSAANPFTVTPSMQTTYTVSGVDGNGCTNSETVTVNVAPLPTVVITPVASTLCSGKTSTFSASGALTYTWMPGNISGATVGLSPTSSTNFTVTGSAGCSNTITVPVTVDPSPTITVIPSKSVICNGQTSTLTPTGAQSYTWTNITTPTSGVVVVNPATSTGYSVSGTAANGCDSQTTFTLTVSGCTGMFENSVNKDRALTIIPNPNNGEFVVKGKEAVVVKLFDALGKLVNTYELNADNNYEARVANVDAGIYFVTFSDYTEGIKIVVTK